MHDLSTYSAACQSKADIEATYRRASADLKAIADSAPRGPMGLTADHVKQSPQYRAAKSSFDYWHNRIREFNRQFLAIHGAQYRAERKAAR